MHVYLNYYLKKNYPFFSLIYKDEWKQNKHCNKSKAQ